MARFLLLLAVLLMPLGMTPAAADSGGHHTATVMPMGQCDQQGRGRTQAAGFHACTMACSAALPAVDLSQEEGTPIARDAPEPRAASILHGLHPDTTTPPPKLR